MNTAVVASLATLLPMAAIAAAATVGRLLWRRKLRRKAVAERLETQGLLQRAGRAEGGRRGGSGDRKRARLTAMLRAQLGSDRRRGIEMLPIEVLPSGLAHQLGVLQDQEKEAGSEAALLTRAGAADLEQGIAAQLARAADSATTSQAWGPVAPSLRMSARDLEFVADADGQLLELGEGGHAVVYLAHMQGVEVAVKVFELQPVLDPHTAWREVSLLRQCAHARIVPLFGVALRGSLLMLAMELMRGGSLRVALQDAELRRRLRWEAGGRQVALDVAEGLHHLHTTQRVMHGGIEAGNVLLDSDLRACLGDMSMARMVGSKARSAAGFCCTHAAPEQLMGYRCTLAADMYGFGILLVELTTQCVVDRRGEWRLPRVPDECPQAVLALIEDCVVADPLRRCTAAEALRRLEVLDSC
ncbi:hypothetical protein CHLNCDRAFT_137604 [Chlorella variabilis]|uniref:Protein kinase domain-containing protein n=1 Tax=Chlorella variabilis TaxID=554065 RepID=E1Z428_CHLVA|nr:hypothetical protein CHLNCDRAFT_137604 [Chlorella variabilis]EFN58982.1 hypothetical protein CHLNCDRAFT_137604 [Chlorella variabilis]|eukprot:XP_005851084.1 hypothetical protein CHLNCDRAFT_137604 [Chlorella variabilis]